MSGAAQIRFVHSKRVPSQGVELWGTDEDLVFPLVFSLLMMLKLMATIGMTYINSNKAVL